MIRNFQKRLITSLAQRSPLNQYCSFSCKQSYLRTFSSSSSSYIRRHRFSTVAIDDKSITYSERQAKYHEMEKNLKYREDPVIMTMDTPQFKSILSDNLLKLQEIFHRHEYEIRIAGGAVRDLLMDKVPVDVDFATTATPQQMVEMFNKENVRMLNMRGEKHGTVTARINDEVNYEVTTLRIDVTTDGRHAEVEFTTNWLLDANRRDLTINSMFLDLDGKVYDYFYGYEDLQNRRVLFVGDAANRIQEDYLRILRYFRFYGRIAQGPNNYDEKTIAAITENIEGLQRISGERIWTELKKILQGNWRIDLLGKLIECGARRCIGLPDIIETSDLFRLKKSLKDRFKDVPINAITILAAVLESREDAIKLHSRLKLSAYERDLAIFLTEHKHETENIDELLYYQKMCLPLLNRSFKLNKEYVLELLKLNDKKRVYDQLVDWEMPRYPLNGTILMENGCPAGKKVKYVLHHLRDVWANSLFTMELHELLAQMPVILKNFADEEQHENMRKKAKTKK